MTLKETIEIYNEFEWCGCGQPNAVLERVKEVLGLLQDTKNWDYINKLMLEDERPDLYYTFFYMLDRVELIQHGSGIHFSWLTEKGKDFLLGLNLYTIEEITNSQC